MNVGRFDFLGRAMRVSNIAQRLGNVRRRGGGGLRLCAVGVCAAPWTPADLAPVAGPVGAQAPQVPRHKLTQRLVIDGQASSGGPVYQAFPALLPLTATEALATYKAGANHAWDTGDPVATLIFDLVTGVVRKLQRFQPPESLLYQCAEPVRFADGSAALFIDTQRIGPEPRHYRAPMRWARLADGGRTFAEVATFPVIDGVG